MTDDLRWVVVIARGRYGVEVVGPFEDVSAAEVWLDDAEDVAPGTCAIVPLREVQR